MRQRIEGGKQKLASLERELQDLAKRTATVRSELDADEQREAQLLSALTGGRRRQAAAAPLARLKMWGEADLNSMHSISQLLTDSCSPCRPCSRSQWRCRRAPARGYPSAPARASSRKCSSSWAASSSPGSACSWHRRPSGRYIPGQRPAASAAPGRRTRFPVTAHPGRRLGCSAWGRAG